MLIDDKCLLLYSGGLDSFACLLWAKERYKKVIAICFDYGQTNKDEIKKAIYTCEAFGVELFIKKIDLAQFSIGCKLLGSKLTETKSNEKVSLAYIPNRNTVFVSLAASFAISKNINEIVCGFIGTGEYAPNDCKPEFIKLITQTINYATNSNLIVKAPFIDEYKKDIWSFINNCGEINFAINHTYSCFNTSSILTNSGYSCNNCDACKMRDSAFKELF